MKRHKSLVKLSRDHHNGLIAAQLMKKDAADYKGMPTDFEGKSEYIVEFYYNHLVPHFKEEESILFPFIQGKDAEINTLVNELKQEHIQIKMYIKAVEENKHDLSLLDELGNLLENHIRKEERILFQRIQEMFGENDLQRLNEILSQ